MRSRFGIERLERRLLLAGETLRFPFMAANFSFEDPSFIRQAEVLKNQRQLEFTIPDGFRSVAGGEDLYEPWGSGTTFLGWPDPGTKFFTRPNPAAGRNEIGIAGAGATVTIVLESLEPAKTVAEAMPLLVARNAARNFALSSGPEAASSKWLTRNAHCESSRGGLSTQIPRLSSSSLRTRHSTLACSPRVRSIISPVTSVSFLRRLLG